MLHKDFVKKESAPDDPLTRPIIGAAIEVHRLMGPGLLESVYEECLCRELKARGIGFERQYAVMLSYKGEGLNVDLVIDLVVQKLVVVELKAVEKVLPVHEAQLLSYMKLSGIKTGLLLNFNVPVLKEGIVRKKL